MVNVDTSSLPWKQETSPSGSLYYSVYYSIILHFGLTEFKAQLAWDENVRLNLCP